MRIRPPELETSICDVKYHVSLSTGCVLGKWVCLVTLAMSLFDLQDVCIVIGSIATLELPMVVDLIGIYVLKGPYYTLTTTNWFLQALSVIPRGSWGDVARRFTMIRWEQVQHLAELFPDQCRRSSFYRPSDNSAADVTEKLRAMEEKMKKDMEARESQWRAQMDAQKAQLHIEIERMRQTQEQFQAFARVIQNIIPGTSGGSHGT
ncbi:hypothetical protein F511_41561 [Dorcoceras hygrometricum]|uniref:Uncharacterized protein n=1 Tax=Dorcoceras hygrometricum TaxID=472368 RepID=A0A2Z7ABM4_9LAMI|nr:hypothetical protein F511_41561 [Dorcoceras hygrometricum]